MFKINNFKQEINDKLILEIAELQMINQGHIVICGEIGCGKSSFVKALVGYYEFSGEVVYNNEAVEYQKSNSQISYVPQNLEYYFLMASVVDEIMFATGLSEQEIDRLLVKYSLSKSKNLSPQSLSGGEKVRLVSLMNEVTKTKTIILDETVAMNDYTNTQTIDQELMAIIDRGILVIEISHELNRIKKADQILFIHEKEIITFNSYEEFKSNHAVNTVWRIID